MGKSYQTSDLKNFFLVIGALTLAATTYAWIATGADLNVLLPGFLFAAVFLFVWRHQPTE